MTDTQFQPGQPTPPTQQGWGVFGGNPEEIIHDPSMFWPLQVEKTTTEEPATEVSPSSPFDGYVIPQESPIVEQVNAVEEIPEIVFPTETVIEPTPVVESTPEPVIIEEKPIEEPVEEPLGEPVVVEEEPLGEPVVVEEEPIEEPLGEPVSDIQQKFANLLDNVSELTSLLRLKDGEILEIIWSNNDKVSVLYQFGLNEQNEVHVKRIETDKEEDETTFNELKLWLNPESHLFEIFLDDVLLFEESDLIKDTKKKSQVIEKINKLIFLTESKLKDTEKELRAKQEEEEERRRLQDIFRNF